MLTDGVLSITDPTYEAPETPSRFARKFGRFVRDERDLPFVKLSLQLSGIFLPLALILFIPGWYRWWLGLAYVGLYLYFLGPFVLMLHNTSHRVLFKREYDIMNKYIPYVVGPFLGQSPETYFVHHMGMHHQEGNLPEDLSSTMKYQRDSFIDFMKYYLSFLFFGAFTLCSYLKRRKKTKLMKRFLIGEIGHYVVMIALTVWNPAAGLTVLVFPFVMTRFLLMAGNWAQHAFVDSDDPTNDWRTVVSFINSKYNHRCFNDGYHLGHHVKAGRHWTEMPADFLKNRERLIAEDALVFEKVDYFVIFLLLMFKRHKTLAGYYVQLDPDNPKSEDEVLELIHSRLRRFEPETLRLIEATA